jgi:hypothetical protein
MYNYLESEFDFSNYICSLGHAVIDHRQPDTSTETRYKAKRDKKKKIKREKKP